MEIRLEAVAKAIWEANYEERENASWEQLSDWMDAGIKAEIYLMAQAAIKACDDFTRR